MDLDLHVWRFDWADSDTGMGRGVASLAQRAEAVGVRTLSFKAPGLRNAHGDEGLEGAVILTQPPDLESVNIATSWAKSSSSIP